MASMSTRSHSRRGWKRKASFEPSHETLRTTGKKVARVALAGAAGGAFTRGLRNTYSALKGERQPITLARYADAAALGGFLSTGLYGGHALVAHLPEWMQPETKQPKKNIVHHVLPVHHVYVYHPRRVKHDRSRKKKR